MQTTTLNVRGMTCNHCAMSIQKAIKPMAGVESVNVSVQKGEVQVTFEPTKLTLNAIKERILEEGYEVAI